MKNMDSWRASVVLPKEMADAIIKLRQKDEFARCSLSDIMRMLIEIGLAEQDNPTNQSA